MNQPRHDPSLDIYLIAIGGTGMAPLACLLREAGHEVRGSDGPLYPPMSELLAAAGIEPLKGFDPAHLEPRPDLVVVGNAVPRWNPEAEEVERLGIPRISMPQALARFFLEGRRPLVVAGTHGKTTTSSLAAWVYSACGRQPGFLVGGIPIGLGTSFARGAGERFIIEGDEYNAAYFDRGPKFLHYRPHTLVLTSAEHDHADLYPTPDTLVAAYRELVALLPAAGRLIACGDDAEVRALAAAAPCSTLLYGLRPDNDLFPVDGIEHHAHGCCFRVTDPEAGAVTVVELPLSGEHNVANALAVWAAARGDGISPRRAAAALADFAGVRRRMEAIGAAGGVTVVDDFAHHPTAVDKTLEALRQRHPDRRLIAVFEPRTLTAGRSFFFDGYARAFRHADRVFFAPIFHAGRLAPEETLDLGALVDRLAAAGVAAQRADSIEELLASVAEAVAPGDVVVSMSSGSFEGFPARLLALL